MGALNQTPEERELSRKEDELAILAERLSQSELEITTVKADLQAFETRCVRFVGVKFAELDEIEAEIAEAYAHLHPGDDRRREQAEEARDNARESARAAEAARRREKQDSFCPMEDLKKLYREAAKAMHPDLAPDEKMRLARQAMMVEVNLAYERQDMQGLRSILRRWENSPESVEGEGTWAELIRIIRRIALVEERLAGIDAEMAELRATDFWLMKEKVKHAERGGRDILSEMAAAVECQIMGARKRLGGLTGAGAG
jgi:multidrug efflux pump subunit AcrA (membrane-fusion protein)